MATGAEAKQKPSSRRGGGLFTGSEVGGADVSLRVYLAANTLLLSSMNVMDIIGRTMRSPNQLLHVYKCQFNRQKIGKFMEHDESVSKEIIFAKKKLVFNWKSYQKDSFID